MKNHIKQMLRTPVQSVLIIILIMIVTVMLAVGGNLWIASDRLSKTYEEDFITIGTVTQKPDTMVEEPKWDAEKKDYRIYKKSGYNRYVTPEDLTFPDVTYLAEPEKRVYWGSHTPEYIHEEKVSAYRMDDSGFVAEFIPKEDCVPDESVKILITKVLGSSKLMEGSVLWFCDHYNKEPMDLKADRTYVAKISFDRSAERHGQRWEEMGDEFPWVEYVASPADLTLYTSEGDRIEDPIEMQSIYEVTEGFYDTDAGKRLLAMAETTMSIYDSQPVVGTNSTDLIMPFYEGNAWVYEGRYPTEEEYAQGSAVCLAPRIFAENNGLTVGDQVTTRLYYTDAGNDVGRFPIFKFSLLDLDGEIPEPFEEKEYTIVGLYDYKPLVEGIGLEELIVPLHSVQNQTENIVAYGAMADQNTSFRIENGTVADFLETSAKHGMDNLIFTFHDRGYSVLIQGIQNLKNMSAALLVMGVIAAVILTLQISHIYITRQKKRLAIERLMGMTVKKCRNISLAGILVLLILGTVPGAAAGTVLAGEIGMTDGEQEDAEDTGQMTEEGAARTDVTQEEFNRKYSNLGMSVETDVDLTGQNQGSLAVSCAMGGLVIILGMGLSGARVRKILRGEPLYLLEDGMAGK